MRFQFYFASWLLVSTIFLLITPTPAHAVTEVQLGELIFGKKVVVTNPYLDTCDSKRECGWAFKTRHPGIDYRARKPTLVHSPVSGTVVHTVRNGKSYEPAEDKTGTIVIKLLNKDNAFFMFGHMSKSLVKVGDKIRVGCKIGFTGKKNTIFPHLHVEYRESATAKPHLTPASKSSKTIIKNGNVSPTKAVLEYTGYNKPFDC